MTSDLAMAGVAGGAAAQVARLAGVVRTAGLDGVVASPHETAAVRAAWPGAHHRRARGAPGGQRCRATRSV